MMKPKRKIIYIFAAFLLIIAAGITGVFFWQKSLVSNLADNITAKPENSTAPQDPEAGSKQIVNLLMLGSDSRADEVGRTDSIMFTSVHLDTKKVAILSIPRDTRVNIPGVGLTKITHANVVGGKEQGPATIVQAASNLVGLPVNYYIIINFQGFKSLVDALDGVDINLAGAIDDQVQNIHLPAGKNHLDGDQALKLARVRYSLPDGDFGRQRLQFQLLSAIADKALKAENIPKLPQILKIISNELLETNLSQPQMLAFAAEFKNFSSQDIAYYQVPGKSLTAHDPLVGADVYYFEADQTQLQAIIKKAFPAE